MNLVEKSLRVAASPDTAFAVFTERIGSWWPLASHHIGTSDAQDCVIEPFVGGRWYERGVDGVICPWGRVLAWEPGARLVLSWEISAAWQADAAIQTEVEVRFTGVPGGTLVELTHRKLEAYGADAQTMANVFNSDGGWTGLLAMYAAAANA